MKTKVIKMALLLVLGTMAVSCQKETTNEPQMANAELGTVYTVRYSINGVTYTERLSSEAEFDALLLRLMALSRNGNDVEISNGNYAQCGNATKQQPIIFTTTNENEAIVWTKQKTKEGYTVTVSYDTETGVYTCIAVK